MRRDSIFYALFQQSPTLLFELLEKPPPNSNEYRFDSVAVKEPKFEIDGVFLPPDIGTPGIVYFCEVQFQKDEQLYERLFGESFLYFYRNRDRFSDWQAVVIYPTCSLEQSETYPYRALLGSDQMHRVYLDELGDIRQLPLGVALMVLTRVKEADAPEAVRLLLERSRRELTEPATSQAIMELLTTIMIYKFTNLSRREIEAMLGLSLQQTRVYQEAREEEARSLILEQLTSLFGEMPQSFQETIVALSSDRLKALSLALLKFKSLADLEQWLKENAS